MAKGCLVVGLAIIGVLIPASVFAATPGTWVLAGHVTSRGWVAATTGKDGLIYYTGSPGIFGAYNPATKKPTTLPSPPGFGCLVTGAVGKIWSINQAMTAGYSTTKGSWTTYAPPPSSLFGGSAACVTGADGLIYVIDTFQGHTYRYTPNTNTWATMASTTPLMGYTSGTAVLGPDQLIYVPSGDTHDCHAPLAMNAYSPTSDSWTSKPAPPICVDVGGGVIGPDGRLYVGYGNNATNMSAYSFVTSSWTLLLKAPNIGTLASAGASLYALGGESTKGHIGGTQVFRYVP